MKKKPKTKKWTIYRSSISGKFITKKYSKQKPKTTVKERIEIEK